MIIGIASQKGGVGKTTLALNLGLSAARRGWKTLLVDADPQGAIGHSLKTSTRASSGLIDGLRGERTLEETTLGTRVPELDILMFGDAAKELAGGFDGLFKAPRLPSLLDRAAAAYDLVLIDTASGAYGATLEILRHCRWVLVPLQAEPLALRSVVQMIDAIGTLREAGSSVELGGFVLTMVRSRNEVSLAVAQEAWRSLPSELVLQSTVPRDDAFLQASAHGVPVGLLGRRPPAVATVFDVIAAELEHRIGLIDSESDDEPIPLLD